MAIIQKKIAIIAQENPVLDKRILPGMPYTYAELEYVIEYEMAYTLKDVLARRWGTQLADWQQTIDLIEPVGAYMAKRLNWSDADKNNWTTLYKNELRQLKQQIIGPTFSS